LFIFADADLKFDQPQAEVVFDRDKLRSQGVDLSEAGRDLSTLLGANYVNRFSIQGRSYKVIPQVVRAERLTPEQLEQIYVTGSASSNAPGGRLVPLSTFASLKTTTEPRDLKKFQQLNAVRIQGVIPPPVPLDRALGFLEDEARKILPQGFSGRSCCPRFSSISCSRRSSRASAIRSSSSAGRCRWRSRAP
jgi:multidrug efflux pump